jgi:hypothetical protein
MDQQRWCSIDMGPKGVHSTILPCMKSPEYGLRKIMSIVNMSFRLRIRVIRVSNKEAEPVDRIPKKPSTPGFVAD